MKLYRFSPIKNEETAQEALIYIHDNLRKLAELVLEEKLPINTLKVFAHYEDEYKFLFDWINAQGTKENEPSKTSYYIKPDKELRITNDPIEFIGLRVPDPYRAQVGCGDFVVPDFNSFKNKYLGKSEHLRKVPHPQYEMLEFFHPDIDVLGYIVNE
jgi:hypothetical protein